jgi:hypothetical protein
MGTKEIGTLMTVKDYAEKIGCSVQNVYQAFKRGTLKKKKIGNFVFVDLG